jgi:DNA-binding transcriptional LysR family regulator
MVTPPRAFPRLPPLNALRAFVAAARRLSFTRAASDLHVTPAAVSQQIKLLEAQLGVALFERRKDGLALTPEAAAVVPGLSDGFAQIADALARLEGLFGMSQRVDFSYWFVCSSAKSAWPKVIAFRDWLQREVKRG